MKKLVLFDFDGTITTKDSFFEFLKFTHSKHSYYANLIKCLPYFFLYFTNVYSAKDLKEKIITIYFKNKSRNELFNSGKLFIEYLLETKIIKSNFITAIENYKRGKYDIAVVSASIDIWIAPFCDKYDLTCICTRTDYNPNFLLSGKIHGANCKGLEKKKRVLETFEIEKYSEIIVFGDSKGDLEMMELATQKNWV